VVIEPVAVKVGNFCLPIFRGRKEHGGHQTVNATGVRLAIAPKLNAVIAAGHQVIF
jgi:hypothetical protein